MGAPAKDQGLIAIYFGYFCRCNDALTKVTFFEECGHTALTRATASFCGINGS